MKIQLILLTPVARTFIYFLFLFCSSFSFVRHITVNTMMKAHNHLLMTTALTNPDYNRMIHSLDRRNSNIDFSMNDVSHRTIRTPLASLEWSYEGNTSTYKVRLRGRMKINNDANICRMMKFWSLLRFYISIHNVVVTILLSNCFLWLINIHYSSALFKYTVHSCQCLFIGGMMSHSKLWYLMHEKKRRFFPLCSL
jgi:hypothetical protein